MSHKYNRVTYSASKLSESEEAEWKNERFQTAIKHYKGIIQKNSESNMEIKNSIRTELAQVLFDVENFDEAVQIYEDAFNVSIYTYFQKIFLSFFKE